MNKIFTFAGLRLASGPLAYKNGKFVISEDWKINSYKKAFGKTDGSTYFNWDEVRDINLDGWRLPTIDEWKAITTTDVAVRPGSTVNGTENAHWALIRLTGISHAGSSNPYGLLLFPDGATITGKFEDTENITIGVTLTDLNEFLAQGCVFLPASGFCSGGDNWYNGGNEGDYWASTQEDADDAWCLYFDYGDLYTYYNDKSDYYFSVRLVRE